METDFNEQISKFLHKQVDEQNDESNVRFLSHLADKYVEYVEKAVQTGHWIDFFKAHGLFNACGKRQPNQSIWHEKAYEVECKHHSLKSREPPNVNQELHYHTNESLKQSLNDIRSRMKLLLSEADAVDKDYIFSRHFVKEQNRLSESSFCNNIKLISEACCKNMLSFVADIMESAVKLTGEPPCKYAVVAIGSLAKCEATPYSDLEYLFLIEVDGYQYEFERLAVTSYVIINNLRESNLKIYDIQELKDLKFVDKTKSGFEIDGLMPKAGNIPTGHGPGTPTNNKFMKTVDGLVALYVDIFASPIKGNKIADLSAMLASTTFICGDNILYETFQHRIHNIKPNEARRHASLKMLQCDVETYVFLPDESLCEMKHVKADIFRFPSIIIYDLKIICQIQSTVVWEVLEELKGCHNISATVASSLEAIMCVAQYVRLKTYLIYKSQNDRISVLPSLSSTEDLAHFPQSLFFSMCLHLVPLKKMINVKGLNLEYFMQEVPEDINEAAAYTCYYLNDFYNCVKHFDNHYKEVSEIKDPAELWMYIDALNSAGKPSAALNLIKNSRLIMQLPEKHNVLLKVRVLSELGMYKEALETVVELEKLDDWRVLLDIADLYSELGERTKSQEYYLQALSKPDANREAIIKMVTSKMNFTMHPHETKQILQLHLKDVLLKYGAESCHPDIAAFYMNIGCSYEALGDYDKAITCYQKFLETWTQVYGNISHPTKAKYYNNFGTAYQAMGDYTQAITYHNKALEIWGQVFENASHPAIANSYNSIGSAYRALGNYTCAIDYCNRSLEMRKQLYGNTSHPAIASSFNSIGSVYVALGDHNKAIDYFIKSLKMRKQVYGNKSHPDIAISYNNIGVAFEDLGDFAKAIDYHSKSLDMRREVFRNTNHPDIAKSYANIGSAHFALGDYVTALDYHNKSLEMGREVYGNTSHPDLANRYNNIGCTYNALGDCTKALTHFNKSLEMRLEVYKDMSHPEIANSYANIGNTYSALGDYVMAIDYYNKSLAMRRAVFGRTIRPDIAHSYNNIGSAYDALGDHSKAIEYYSESLEMLRQLYSNTSHPAISTLYSNIGAAYHLLGSYTEAVEYYNKSLGMKLQLYRNASHPTIAVLYHNIGLVFCKQGKIHHALSNMRKSYLSSKSNLLSHERPLNHIKEILFFLHCVAQIWGRLL